MALSFGSGLLLGSHAGDLPFVWFVQTMAFVNFNKVCTSQVSLEPGVPRIVLLLLPWPRYH